MEQKVRMISIQLAVLIFFAMALTGWLWGCSPAVCGTRALGGAIVMYIVVQIAGRIVLKIIIDAIAESQVRKQANKDEA